MNPPKPLLLALLLLAPLDAREPTEPQISVFFSPGGGGTEAVVREIASARKVILGQAYSFTSVPIAKALVEASRRGVDVRMILDGKSNNGKYSEATFLARSGVPVWADTKHAIAHNKILLIDNQTILT